MTAVSDTYDALHYAMQHTSPNCADDARFIADDTDPEHIAHLCMLCPLLDPCSKFARIARPRGGIWAGIRWGTRQVHHRPLTPRREQ